MNMATFSLSPLHKDPLPTKAAVEKHKNLQQETVEQYLARGGEIEQVPGFKTSKFKPAWQNPMEKVIL